jgi:hypothetical protein
MPLVRYLSTRIAVMERGRLVEMGEAEALCAEPREAYTRQLLQGHAGVAGWRGLNRPILSRDEAGGLPGLKIETWGTRRLPELPNVYCGCGGVGVAGAAHGSQVVGRWSRGCWSGRGCLRSRCRSSAAGPLQRREQASAPGAGAGAGVAPGWAAHLGVAGRPEASDVRPGIPPIPGRVGGVGMSVTSTSSTSKMRSALGGIPG